MEPIMKTNQNIVFSPSVLDAVATEIFKLFKISPLSLTQDEVESIKTYAQYTNMQFRNLQKFTDNNLFSQFLNDNTNSLTYVLRIEEAVMNYHGCNVDNVDQLLSIIDPIVSEMSEKILQCLDVEKLQKSVHVNKYHNLHI